TSYARAWHSGENYGVEIRGPIEGDDFARSFESREHMEHIPRLVVTYHMPELAGHVYEGEVGDETQPVEGATVALYGANNPYPDEGTFIISTTTGADGAYGLETTGAYEFYHIRSRGLPGYVDNGATTLSGTVRSDNWIEYVIPLSERLLTGNNFWKRALRLSGYVYAGAVGNTDAPIEGVTLGLYCSGNTTDLGTEFLTTTTNAQGWYGLLAYEECPYYNIVEVDPAEYVSVGAESLGGTVIDANRILYGNLLEAGVLDGNNFWDEPPGAVLAFVAGPDIVGITPDSAMITWETNRAASGAVYYDTWAGRYENRSVDEELLTHHSFTLTNLTPATTYHFFVQSIDERSDVLESRSRSFETLPPPDTEDPTVVLGEPEVYRDVVTVTATAEDNVGVEKVEFYLDGELLLTDYAPPYICQLDTVRYLNGEHILLARAYDLSGRTIIDDRGIDIVNRIDTTAPTVVIDSPTAGITISGTFNVNTTLTDDVGVFRAYFYVDGVLKGHRLFPANTTNTTAQFALDTTELSNDDHRIGVRVYDTEFKSGLDTVDIVVNNPPPEPEPKLVLTGHSATRYQNSFSIKLVVKNVGTATASDVQLRDSSVAFQATSRMDLVNGPAEYTAYFYPDSMTGECVIESLADIAPGQSLTYTYGAVPVLVHPKPPTPAIGTVVRLSYKSPGGTTYSNELKIPVAQTTGGETIVTAYDNALKQADYLIVTNPRRLLWNDLPHSFFGTDVFPLLSEMAQLAIFNDGVLGYLDVNDRNVLDALIVPSGTWGKRLHPDFRTAAQGYMLIVGETEIIPSWLSTGWNMHWSNFACTTDQVDLTDLPYADTTGNGAPELIVGRIIGNTAQDLTHAIQTSNRVYAGYTGYGFDRSDALLVSGTDGNTSIQNTFKSFVTDTLKIIQSEFSVDVLHWSAIASTQRVTEFRNNTGGQDVVCYQGHGGPDSWGPLNTTDFPGTLFVPPISFGTNNPLVLGWACLTGSYETHSANAPCGDFGGGDDNLAEAFFDSGAAVYIGSTEVSPINQNVPAGKAFFNTWWGPYTTVGKALTDLKRDRWGHSHSWRFWVTEYNLYGDPKYGAAPPGRAVNTTVQVATEPQASVIITIPDYVVTAQNGWDYVEIPGGEVLLEHEGYRIPYYAATYTYPDGYEIQDVVLTARDDVITATGLSIPTVTNLIAAPYAPNIPRATAEWLPGKEPYEWSVLDNPDGSSVLSLILYPFEYNPATTDVRFYRDYAFDIDYLTSTVSLAALSVDQPEYVMGDPLTVSVEISNTGTPLDVVLNAQVRDYGSDMVVGGLALHTLQGLQGLATFDFGWPGGEFEPGYYYVEVQAEDSQGDILDRRTQHFRLGTYAGLITHFAATPEQFEIGDTVDFSLVFNNTGSLPLTGTAVVNVQSAVSNAVAAFAYPIAGLEPGNDVRFDDVWDTSGVEPGTYRLLGYVLYDSMATAPVTATLTSTGALSGTRYVASSGTDTGNDCTSPGTPCATLQHAVDAAAPGDAVYMAGGTYTGITGITKTVAITGGYAAGFSEHDPETYPTILDAQWSGSVITIADAGTVQLAYLTLTHGDGTGNCDSGCGGGISAAGTDLYVNHCVITDNVGRTSSGWGSGGGIYVEAYGGRYVEIVYSQVISNTANTDSPGRGGGIIILGGTAQLAYNEIRDNVAGSSDGGGIYLGGLMTSAEVLDNVIANNQGRSGGGLMLDGVATANIFGNQIVRNQTDSIGGSGVWMIGGAAHFSRNVVMSNTTGSGLRLKYHAVVTLSNNLIANNSRGIDVLSASPSPTQTAQLINNTIVDNNDNGISLFDYAKLTVTNTLIAGHPTGIYLGNPLSATLSVATSLLWNSDTFTDGQNLIIADPLLTPDYRLYTGSPALDAGLTIPWLTTDIEGIARPQASGYDIGAYEGDVPLPDQWYVYLPLILR
ncbi:MAG: right-handed parallel beta-helix repeat-containing protein, partial [Anaerolineae bacterium]|nr:right-handed parallel beta-helix repeat-containing protein [Anaerolineae bacterium]